MPKLESIKLLILHTILKYYVYDISFFNIQIFREIFMFMCSHFCYHFYNTLMKHYCVFCSSAESRNPQKSSLLSRLAKHFPFVFNFLRKQSQSNSNQVKDSLGSANLEDMHSGDTAKNDMQVDVALVSKRECSDINHEEMLIFSHRNPSEVLVSR